MQGPETRASLLYRLRDHQHHEVWSEFVDVYQPLIYNVAVSRGVQHSDALDIVQEVLSAVATAISKFDPDSSKGSFRGWLFRITRNVSINRLTRGEKFRSTTDSQIQTLLAQRSSSFPEASTTFDLHRKKLVFRWAAKRVKHRVTEMTWQSFWLTAIDGHSISRVAKQLRRSNGAIRIARCRVMSMLKSEVKRFQEADSSVFSLSD